MDLPSSSKSNKPVKQECRGHYSATARKSNRPGSVPPLRSRNYQKPWPSTKGTGPEELVKYMSNVPSYLHGVDPGNFQEKALNVGVLDWKYLEKWKDKHSDASHKHRGDPQSSGYFSSHISASRTSIESCGSLHSPHRRREKYSSVLNSGQSRFSEGWQKAYEQSRDKFNKGSTEKSDKKAHSCRMPLPSSNSNSPFGGHESVNKMQSPKVQDCPRDQHSQDFEKDQCLVITDFRDGSAMEVHPQNILHEDVKLMGVSSQIPHSYPLPFSVETDEIAASSPPFSKESFRTIKEYRHVQDEMKPSIRMERGLSPTRQFIVGLNRINRSSSVRDGSPKRQMEGLECSDASNGNKAKANSKGRQSPLRRILDPLLKPMNRFRSSSPVAKSRIHNTIDNDNSLLREDTVSTEEQRQSCEKQSGSTRQALLQLAWKNELPLYMLSFNDNDILAATVSKKNDLAKDEVECIYTLFSVKEAKKKSGTWMNHGNQSKKDGLVSTVVGQMKVSSRKPITDDSKSGSSVREFVLFGSQVESVSSRFQDELAAVLVKDEKQNSHSLQHQSTGFSTASSIVAILPSGVHGLSSVAHPTPLIERWMSGGSCDCGGWDEGCTLRVLTDTLQEGQSLGPVQAHDGTHRIELFLQGGEPRCQDRKQTFTMVAFKEGLYTVDFVSSIPLLQAFSICISILHSRYRELRLAEKKSLQDHFSATRSSSVAGREAPASYVANHPPLSPYGRA